MSKRSASSSNGAFLGFIAVLAVGGVAIAFFKDNWPYIVAVLAVLIILFIVLHIRNKRRREVYLALPVLFIGNSSTHVYHTLSCSKASGLSPNNAVAFRSLDEIRRSGYTPCRYCKP